MPFKDTKSAEWPDEPVDADRDARTVPWVVVGPENPDDPEAGWGIWTRELRPNMRVAWASPFPDTEANFEHIVALHNASLAGREGGGDDGD